MAKILGMSCKAYFAAAVLGGAVTPANADWTEMDNLKDVTKSLSTDKADVTTRANSGWKQNMATLKDGSVKFEMLWDSEDEGFDAIRDAWLASSEIGMAFMNGDIETGGKEGLVGNFVISGFEETEPLSDAVAVSVTADPSSETEWYTVGGS